MTETTGKSTKSASPDSGAKRHKKSYSAMHLDNSVLTVYAKNLRDDLGGENDTETPKDEALDFLQKIAPEVKEILVYGKEGDVETRFGKIKRDYRSELMTAVDDSVDEYLLHQLKDAPLTKLTLQRVSMLNPSTMSGLLCKCKERNFELIVENVQVSVDQSVLLEGEPYEYDEECYIMEITGKETFDTISRHENGSGDQNGKDDEKTGGDDGAGSEKKLAELAKKYAESVSKNDQEELKKQLVKIEKDEKLRKEVQDFVGAVLKQYAPELVKGEEDDKVDVSSLDFSKMDALALRLLWWWTSSWANEQYENRKKSARPNDDKTNGNANSEQDDGEEPADSAERGEGKTP
ncbi:hypothetical protein RvY_13611 [Ramazzottius varieornatus]|uniref:Uncharacterized protein n=1 Tax=Ramazzottius varieornatus TaxID=947166 RepID=A0A1D1VNG9_RAMVA|nr:hypothetical protein RvY_13611 [Ramazzottius varieornatus]